MEEQSQEVESGRSGSAISANSKARPQPKERIKVSFDEALQVVLEEDGPLLERLAE